MRRLLPMALLAVLAVGLPAVALAQDPGVMIERQYGVVTDPAQNARLGRVGGRILGAARQVYPSFRSGNLYFKIIRNQDLNAMSLPDGRIYVTSAMMNALASRPDDELAALLGHEATHVTQRHAASQNRQSLLGALLGGLIGRQVGGASTGIRVGGALTGAMYSRDDEYRADAGSVQLLRVAGYDPYAMGRLLGLLRDRYGRGSAKTPVIGWFASHPDTAKRIENADRVADRTTGRAR